MRARGLGRAVVLCALAFVVAACDLLAPSFDTEDFLDPKPIVTYATGSATITLGDGTKIELDRLHGKAELYESYGAMLAWRGPDGWYLTLSASSMFGMDSSYMTIERVHEGSHWTTSDASRCIVDLATLGETGVKGTATCKGLEWYDLIGGGMSFSGNPVKGEKKFDAEITFEAAPKGQIG